MKTRLTALTAAVSLAVAGLASTGLSTTAMAWDDCDHRQDIDQVVSLEDVSLIDIEVNAGDLRVIGSSDDSEIRVSGVACMSKAKWLDEFELKTGQRGDRAFVETAMPDTDSWGWGNNYAYVDLTITVPDSIELKVSDSSGDAEIRDVATLTVRDSSGDLEIYNVSGDLDVKDSSGDLEIDGVDGQVELEDSSGDIEVSNVSSRVLVHSDSSGDIDIESVEADVRVDRDSSGSIYVADIAGDFSVGSDTSGGIRHRNVVGRVDVPDDD